MDVMKYTLEEFIKMCENGDYIAKVQQRNAAKFQNLLNRIIQTCGVIRDCYFDCGAKVVFASSKGADEKIHLTTYCDSNYAVTVAVGLIRQVLSNEDIPAEALLEEIKTRIFEED